MTPRWAAATGQELRTLSGHTDAVNGVAFSPDGKTVATAKTGTGGLSAIVWDAATWQIRLPLAGG